MSATYHTSRRQFVKGAGFAAAAMATAGIAGPALADAPAFENEGGELVLPEGWGDLPYRTDDESAPIVYFTKAITPQGVKAAFDALGQKPHGRKAIKLSSGEPKGVNNNYLRPALIGELVMSLGGDKAIVECNTVYGGSRDEDESHYQAAVEHGFTDLAPFDIMDRAVLDEEGNPIEGANELTLPVEGGEVLTENYVGAHFANYDWWLTLSHFKGHSVGGFGGALKNISIGIASRQGKCHIHSAGQFKDKMFRDAFLATEQDDFTAAMAEAAKSVVDATNHEMCFVNVMNRLSIHCDCSASPAEPTMADIGVLSSMDPVALDQACYDLVYAAPDGADLQAAIEARNGVHILEHAEKINFGSRNYRLVCID